MLYAGSDVVSHGGVAFWEDKANMPWHFRMGEKSSDIDRKDKYFQAVTAACCFMRAENFVNAGKLNENLRWAFEDIDICLDIGKNQKKKIVYCGRTNIEHETSATLKKNNYNRLFLQSNVAYFRSKWTDKYSIDYKRYLKDPNHNNVR
jgi:GT2 family glycosyltransferase